jgi:hypothetical protein
MHGCRGASAPRISFRSSRAMGTQATPDTPLTPSCGLWISRLLRTARLPRLSGLRLPKRLAYPQPGVRVAVALVVGWPLLAGYGRARGNAWVTTSAGWGSSLGVSRARRSPCAGNANWNKRSREYRRISVRCGGQVTESLILPAPENQPLGSLDAPHDLLLMAV